MYSVLPAGTSKEDYDPLHLQFVSLLLLIHREIIISRMRRVRLEYWLFSCIRGGRTSYWERRWQDAVMRLDAFGRTDLSEEFVDEVSACYLSRTHSGSRK